MSHLRCKDLAHLGQRNALLVALSLPLTLGHCLAAQEAARGTDRSGSTSAAQSVERSPAEP